MSTLSNFFAFFYEKCVETSFEVGSVVGPPRSAPRLEEMVGMWRRWGAGAPPPLDSNTTGLLLATMLLLYIVYYCTAT